MASHNILLSTALILNLCAASLPADPPLAPSEPSTQPTPHLITWGKHTCVALKTETIEARVALEPEFRVLSLNTPGEPTLLGGPDNPQEGVRLAFMEPQQIPDSFKVGDVPAKVLAVNDHELTVMLEQAAGLQYEVKVSLDAHSPAATLTYRLTNKGDVPREVGIWSVFAFARDGKVIAPFDTEPRARRQLVLSWWTAWPQPNVTFGRDALLVDANAPIAGTAYKIGLKTDAAWLAFARGDQLLVTHAEFNADKNYPEDGANVTIFEAVGEKTWTEMERLGPLTVLAPGEQAELVETVRLLKFTPPAELNADTYRTAIESAMKSEDDHEDH